MTIDFNKPSVEGRELEYVRRSIDNGHMFGTVAVGSHPDAMALSGNQSFLLVADSGSNDVAVVRTKVARGDKPALLTMIPVGARPSGIAIKAFLQ